MGCRIAVDAMGDGQTLGAIVRGATQAAQQEPGIDLILVGDAERIGAELSSVSGSIDRIQVADASQSIGLDERPVEAIRSKKDASLLRAIELVAEGEADAVVSTGNVGACLAACQLKMRALPCISRPGIAVTIPTFHGPMVLCDAGANVQAKAHNLYEYAVMASLFAERFWEVESPRVGLLSIGGNTLKNAELTRQTKELLGEDDRIRFVGNVEGRDLFNDTCDVTVCDGLLGGIVVEVAEGLAEGMLKTVSSDAMEGESELENGFGQAAPGGWSGQGCDRYGGSPLLGIDGTCVLCRGHSSEGAIHRAVLGANKLCGLGFNEAVMARLALEGAGTGCR